MHSRNNGQLILDPLLNINEIFCLFPGERRLDTIKMLLYIVDIFGGRFLCHITTQTSHRKSKHERKHREGKKEKKSFHQNFSETNYHTVWMRPRLSERWEQQLVYYYMLFFFFAWDTTWCHHFGKRLKVVGNLLLPSLPQYTPTHFFFVIRFRISQSAFLSFCLQSLSSLLPMLAQGCACSKCVKCITLFKFITLPYSNLHQITLKWASIGHHRFYHANRYKRAVNLHFDFIKISLVR